MSCFQVRTDLALEARESIGRAEEELPGIRVEEYDKEEIQVHVTKVVISSKNGAKAMQKPMGNYITLEAPAMQEADESYHREISKELAKQLKDNYTGCGYRAVCAGGGAWEPGCHGGCAWPRCSG